MSGPRPRHRVEQVAVRLLAWACGMAPEPAVLAAGAALGRTLGSVARLRRTDVDRHLGWAFPEASTGWRRSVAGASYAHLGREGAVLLRSRRWTPAEIRARTRMVGFEAFREAAAAGGGVVLLTGHLGNWELGGAAIAAHGVPLDVVAKGMSNPLFQADLFAARAGLGMRVIEVGDASREAPRALSAGRVLALLGDQQAHRGGVPIPFFGRPALTARGPALFALRSKAPVFVAFCIAQEGPTASYTVTFERLAFRAEGDLGVDVPSFLRSYGAALETAIRTAPEQYFWQHRRWKNAQAPAAKSPPEPHEEG